jgi:hypothetical protein
MLGPESAIPECLTRADAPLGFASWSLTVPTLLVTSPASFLCHTTTSTIWLEGTRTSFAVLPNSSRSRRSRLAAGCLAAGAVCSLAAARSCFWSAAALPSAGAYSTVRSLILLTNCAAVVKNMNKMLTVCCLQWMVVTEPSSTHGTQALW